jgi:hypothetical protein
MFDKVMPAVGQSDTSCHRRSKWEHE